MRLSADVGGADSSTTFGAGDAPPKIDGPPFVGAGVGSYFLQPMDNGDSFGPSNTRVGARFLGGVEFFTARTFSVKGEARYDVVPKVNGYNPSGLSLSIGVKSYF